MESLKVRYDRVKKWEFDHSAKLTNDEIIMMVLIEDLYTQHDKAKLALELLRDAKAEKKVNGKTGFYSAMKKQGWCKAKEVCEQI